VGVDIFGRFRVGLLETAEDGCRIARPFPRQPGPDFGISRRRGEQLDEEGADVEVAAANHDRGEAAAGDLADSGPGLIGELAGRETLPGIGHVDQVMPDPASILGRRFVGSNVEAPIDGECIRRHDLSAQPLGHLEPKTRFPRSRRTGDHQQRCKFGSLHPRKRSLTIAIRARELGIRN